MTATTALTCTVSPSVTLIWLITPATGAGISASTLSVEISKSGSSFSTRSPSFFSHLEIVPSTIDSPIWGINTSVVIQFLFYPKKCPFGAQHVSAVTCIGRLSPGVQVCLPDHQSIVIIGAFGFVFACRSQKSFQFASIKHHDLSSRMATALRRSGRRRPT